MRAAGVGPVDEPADTRVAKQPCRHQVGRTQRSKTSPSENHLSARSAIPFERAVYQGTPRNHGSDAAGGSDIVRMLLMTPAFASLGSEPPVPAMITMEPVPAALPATW
jgi:hypothetical protein